MDISRTSLINALPEKSRAQSDARSGATLSGPQKDHSHDPVIGSSLKTDVISISNAAKALHQAASSTSGKDQNDEAVKQTDKTKSPGVQLSEDDLKQVQELKQRDQEVRTHEAAHLAAAGKYATGGPSFDYKRGPDGKNYAVGGEVGIDTSPIANDPEATLQKAQQIRAAAQAPANPSAQDRQVAASASQMEAKARQEIAEQRLEGNEELVGKVESENSEPDVSTNSANGSNNAIGSNNSADNSNNAENAKTNNAVTQAAASAYKEIDAISQTNKTAEALIRLTA